MGGQRKAELIRASTSAAAYAQFPGIAGCQVKMLTGNRCAAAVPITPATVAEAKRRLQSTLGFVGLTDHYNLSVCLLHAMYPAGGRIRPSSFANARPTAYFQDGYNPDRANVEITAEMDPYDMELFIEARTIFVERLKAHGFAVPSDLEGGAGQQRHPGPSVFDYAWRLACFACLFGTGADDTSTGAVVAAAVIVVGGAVCWTMARKRGSMGRFGGVCREVRGGVT